MKRSEMELNIATNIVITKPYIDFKEAQALAEIALISVLENGMLPPESSRSRRTMMFDLQHTQYAHVWDEDDFFEEQEPEDD